MTIQILSRGEAKRAIDMAASELRRMAGPIFSSFEKSGLPMIATDPRSSDNPIVYVNEAFSRVTGYSPEEAIGRNCRFLQTPDTDQGAVAKIREAIRAGRAISAELLNRRKDGSQFWNHLFITPICNGRVQPATS